LLWFPPATGRHQTHMAARPARFRACRLQQWMLRPRNSTVPPAGRSKRQAGPGKRCGGAGHAASAGLAECVAISLPGTALEADWFCAKTARSLRQAMPSPYDPADQTADSVRVLVRAIRVKATGATVNRPRRPGAKPRIGTPGRAESGGPGPSNRQPGDDWHRRTARWARVPEPSAGPGLSRARL